MNVWLSEIWRAWRASLRRPAFLLLATGVLALGVGASAAVFTLIDQALLKPLPVPQPSRLVSVGLLTHDGEVYSVTPREYERLRSLEGVRSIGLMEASAPAANIAGHGQPLQVPVTYADRGLLPTLGLHMQLGRNFNAQEDAPHGPKVVILSHGLWQRRFGGDPGVIGSSLQIEGVAHTIVGVLPAAFDALGNGGQIMLPTAIPETTQDNGRNYSAVARLAAGTVVATVDAQVEAKLHVLYAKSSHAFARRARFGARDYTRNLRAGAHSTLTLFQISALFVLLIALVNLTNLMLLRALARQHDAAVRSALGAPTLRLLLPALAEGLLVGVAGAVLGMLLAVFGLTLLRGVIPAEWLPNGELHVAPAIWGLALLLGVSGALLAAVIGLWRSRLASAIDDLREGGRAGIGRHGGRLGRVLVVAQVALATALLCATGMFLHTLYGAVHTPLGFSDRGVLTFELAPIQADYPDAASVQTLSTQLLQRLRKVPGVIDAVAATNLPAGGHEGQFNLPMRKPAGQRFSAQYHAVSPGYFKLFGIRLRKGRGFARGDVRGGEPVAVISQVMADHIYGGHALGKTIQVSLGAPTSWSARIVGVVDGTRQRGPLDEPQPALYVPLAQVPDPLLHIFRSFEPMRFALKMHGDPAGYREALHRAVADVAPSQPIAHIRSMPAIVSSTLAPLRMDLLLIGLFGVLALLLAGAGLYAVMAVAVAAREREFGVRTALGAEPARLIRLVLRSGLWQIGFGLLLGVVLSLSLSGVLRAVMAQINRSSLFDPLATVGVCVLLTGAGVLACLLPAVRAARVQPMHALRGE